MEEIINSVVVKPENAQLSGLSGNDAGAAAFEKYANNRLDYSKKITIIFDSSIKLVSESFVQGFFDKMISQQGKQYILQNVEIKAGTPLLQQMIGKYIGRI